VFSTTKAPKQMKSLSELFETLDATKFNGKIQYLSAIFKAIFAIPGAISMKAIARTKLIASRTLERQYDKNWEFEKLRITWFKTEVSKAFEDDQFIGAIDDTTTAKSGTKTHGVGNFYAGKVGKAIPGINVCSLSLVHKEKKTAYPIINRQVVNSPEDTARIEAAKAQVKANKNKPRGRAKGTKNKDKKDNVYVETALYRTVKASLEALCLACLMPKYFVADAAFGVFPYINLICSYQHHLISKLRTNASLHFVYEGEQKQRGAKKVIGDKVNLSKLKERLDLACTIEGFAYARQFQAWHGNGKQRVLLNVVVLYLDEKDPKRRIILFSTDRDLSADKLVAYYQLRFEIEFIFRECKQYFGLDSFKNRKAERVEMAIELSFTSVFISKLLQVYYEDLLGIDKVSTLDVLAMQRIQFQVENILMMNETDPSLLLNPQNIRHLAKFEAVNL
jgi:putative transposase